MCSKFSAGYFHRSGKLAVRWSFTLLRTVRIRLEIDNPIRIDPVATQV